MKSRYRGAARQRHETATRLHRRTFITGLAVALAGPAAAQELDNGQGTLTLAATLGTGDPLEGGLRWRVFKARQRLLELLAPRTELEKP